MKREEIKEIIEEKIGELEQDRARGEYGNGNWHFARAWRNGDEIEITTGVEASECYPEPEYYGKPNHPVTFWTCKEHYSPSPGEGTLEWNDCTWDDEDFYYAHLPENYDDYVIVDQHDVEELKAKGYVPFYLGPPVDAIDIEEMVKTAVDEICEAWGIEE